MILKYVLRNLRRHPFLNLIKLAGLMLAFSSVMLIALYLKHELSYDRFHSESGRIYRFTITSPSVFSGKTLCPDLVGSFYPRTGRNFP